MSTAGPVPLLPPAPTPCVCLVHPLCLSCVTVSIFADVGPLEVRAEPPASLIVVLSLTRLRAPNTPPSRFARCIRAPVGASMLWRVSMLHFLLLPNNIPLYDCT